MANSRGYSPSNSLRKNQSGRPISGSAVRSYTRAGKESNKVSVNRGTECLDIPTPKGK